MKAPEQRRTILTKAQTYLVPDKSQVVAPAVQNIWASVSNLAGAVAGALAATGLAPFLNGVHPVVSLALTVACAVVGAIASTWHAHGVKKRATTDVTMETILVQTILYGGAALSSFASTKAPFLKDPQQEWLTVFGPLGFAAWIAGVVSQFSIGSRLTETEVAPSFFESLQEKHGDLFDALLPAGKERGPVFGPEQVQNLYDTLREVVHADPEHELGPSARMVLEQLVKDRLLQVPNDKTATKVKEIMGKSQTLDVSDALVLVSQLLCASREL